LPPAAAALGSQREIDAQKPTAGKRHCHANQILAITAANFQNSARRHRRRAHAKQSNYGGEAVGVSLGLQAARIGQGFVILQA